MGQKRHPRQSTVPRFSANALQVLEARYLLRDAGGTISESPAQMLARVADFVASGETKANRGRWASRYFELMAGLRFLPNTPTLINAGKEDGQLSACFVLPVEDSLDGIFESLKDAAKIHQSGGGTGFAFSRLRSKGSRVKSTSGVASGPVSFIRIFDTATETIKQGGARRGANMAILRVDHPDILEFIESKRDRQSILNFNISVGVTHEFMAALAAGSSISLREPGSGIARATVPAREIFDRICQTAWECGDPGLVFLDRINLFNPTPEEGPMEATNPCGEQPLLAYESCNLGSLNVSAYYDRDAGVDWGLLAKDVSLAMRFLDSIVDLNSYPIPESRKITLRNRKVGLGIMGFADLLLAMGLPYGSRDALELGERLMGLINRQAKRASFELAAEKGRFPGWKDSLWRRLGYPPMRNATVSTIAPTGTISILAGVSSGIEPVFSASFHRNVLSGARLSETHPSVARAFEQRGLDPAGASDEAAARVLGKAWSPAQSVRVEDHIRMQAVFQRHSDSAVSKTINLPESASVEDVAHAYRLAYELGCKGITIYRDRSRPTQVLEKANCPTC